MIVVEKTKVMKKKIKKNRSVDFKSIEINRVSVVSNIVNSLNDDSCVLSSCEIRLYILNAMDAC